MYVFSAILALRGFVYDGSQQMNNKKEFSDELDRTDSSTWLLVGQRAR